MNPGSAGATRRPSTALTVLFAVGCGLCVANIYYAQPLIGPIAEALQLHAGLAGLVMSLTQLGYGAGLLLLVPLADVVENRRLVLVLIGGAVLGLLGVALAGTATSFLVASFVIGVCAVAAQVLVPFASHLAAESSRGKVVGNVMAGLLGGIMLARPFSSVFAAAFGWRTVFDISALLMAGLAAMLGRALPQRRPVRPASYARTLASLPGIVRTTPLLRRRALYQALLFGAFQAFWTVVPLVLARDFDLSQIGIAVFALAGAAGALLAPWAGRLADRGRSRIGTVVAMVAVVLSFVIAAAAVRAGSLAALVVAALLVDGAVQAAQIFSIRSLYMLAPELRGRLNGLYMTSLFVSAAIASAAAAAVYTWRGWGALCVMGGGLGLIALAYGATEFGRASGTAQSPREG